MGAALPCSVMNNANRTLVRIVVRRALSGFLFGNPEGTSTARLRLGWCLLSCLILYLTVPHSITVLYCRVCPPLRLAAPYKNANGNDYSHPLRIPYVTTSFHPRNVLSGGGFSIALCHSRPDRVCHSWPCVSARYVEPRVAMTSF